MNNTVTEQEYKDALKIVSQWRKQVKATYPQIKDLQIFKFDGYEVHYRVVAESQRRFERQATIVFPKINCSMLYKSSTLSHSQIIMGLIEKKGKFEFDENNAYYYLVLHLAKLNSISCEQIDTITTNWKNSVNGWKFTKIKSQEEQNIFIVGFPEGSPYHWISNVILRNIPF